MALAEILTVVSTQSPFLGGAICMLAIIVALLLLRVYRRTRDLLFLLFSISFLLQGLGRSVTYLLAPADQVSPDNHPEKLALYYAVRLVAYGLIIIAIVYKNLSRPNGPGGRAQKP